jgi:phosphoribosyl 1,2-cyclic phosphodiesterase
MEPSALHAVAVTHEHIDHVRGLPPLVRAGIPIITTSGTAEGLELSRGVHRPVLSSATTEVGDLTLTTMQISHDAREPVAYLVEHADARVLLLTDLGKFNDAYLPALGLADLIIIESNHDEAMLRRGPYPPHLKRRVASDLGHLSNESAGTALATALSGRTSVPTIWLGHLSETNNRPDLAVTATVGALARIGKIAPVTALRRGRVSPPWLSDPEYRPAVQARLLI